MRSNRSSGQAEQSANVIRLCRGMSLSRTTLVGEVGDLGDGGGGGLETEGRGGLEVLLGIHPASIPCLFSITYP